jgi:hypothetical protein
MRVVRLLSSFGYGNMRHASSLLPQISLRPVGIAELLMPGSAPSVVRFTKQAEQKIEHEHHTDCIDSNTEWKYRHRLPRTSAESASSEDKVTALALPRHKRLISSS